MECNCLGRQESMCKKAAGAGPPWHPWQRVVVLGTLFRAKSSRLDGSFVYQQDRDIAPHRIHAMAVAAFQAFPIILHHQRLFARGANQKVEEFLGNHAEIVRQKADSSSRGPADCRPIPSSGWSRITGGAAAEGPKAAIPDKGALVS